MHALETPWIAALVALMAWWASTGVILIVVKWADRGGRHMLALVLSMPFFVLGAYGVWATQDDSSVLGLYGAFFAALALWGWIELSFLTGLITGPNRMPRRLRLGEWDRFLAAFGTIAYHEILLLLVLCVLVWLTQDAANWLALATFGVLFFARISAKLNLFFGVAKVNTEFLPTPLAHLPSHFRTAKMTWFFPMSVTGLALATGAWAERLWTTGDVAYALLTTLTALALLEHWLLMVPLGDEKLWRWLLPQPKEHDEKG